MNVKLYQYSTTLIAIKGKKPTVVVTRPYVYNIIIEITTVKVP